MSIEGVEFAILEIHITHTVGTKEASVCGICYYRTVTRVGEHILSYTINPTSCICVSAVELIRALRGSACARLAVVVENLHILNGCVRAIVYTYKVISEASVAGCVTLCRLLSEEAVDTFNSSVRAVDGYISTAGFIVRNSYGK